jgi:acyl-CoA synthetase (AMP-forming)/AMP-acid ligase II
VAGVFSSPSLLSRFRAGATVVLKPKFSASQFWDDCQKHRVTVFQYIGELCRYLVNQPPVSRLQSRPDNRRHQDCHLEVPLTCMEAKRRPSGRMFWRIRNRASLGIWKLGAGAPASFSPSQSKAECDHKVRLAVGSGLRPDTWERFLRRFGPLQILETYGMTEGNVATFNYTGRQGAVGRASWLYKVRDRVDRRTPGAEGGMARAGAPGANDAVWLSLPAHLPLLLDSIRCHDRGAYSECPGALHDHISRFVLGGVQSWQTRLNLAPEVGAEPRGSGK